MLSQRTASNPLVCRHVFSSVPFPVTAALYAPYLLHGENTQPGHTLIFWTATFNASHSFMRYESDSESVSFATVNDTIISEESHR